MKIKSILTATLFLLFAGAGFAQKFEFGTNISFLWTSNIGSDVEPNYTGKRFVANTYGAKADTAFLSTKAIQTAIDACAKAGGGMVVLQPGKYKTGALFVKSGVNLYISKSVTLLASRDLKDYPEIDTRVAGIEMKWPSALLNVIDQENAAITGFGLVDGRGDWCWNNYWAMRKDYEARGLRWIVDYDCKRIRGILVQNSKNITLKGFRLQRTGFWGCQILYSNHCTIDGLTIDNNIGGHGPSTDGIDIDSSSRILIENCDINCNDDNICLKAGRDWDGQRVNRPCEYVVVRDCITRNGAGMITCGSETSGWIRNILAYDMKAEGTSNVLRLKSAKNRGGGIECVYVTRVEATNNNHVLVADLNWYPAYSYSKLPVEYEGKEVPKHWTAMLTPLESEEKGWPRVCDIYMSKVKASGVKEFVYLSGMSEEHPLENIYLYDLNIQAEKQGSIVNTKNYNLRRATLNISEQKANYKPNEAND